MKRGETGFVTHWRPLAAYAYLAICLFDFIVMPFYYERTNARMTPERLVEVALQFQAPVQQSEALRTLRAEHRWEPLTLKESGMFHIAFGAILTGAVIGRSQEKVAFARMSDARTTDSGGPAPSPLPPPSPATPLPAAPAAPVPTARPVGGRPRPNRALDDGPVPPAPRHPRPDGVDG